MSQTTALIDTTVLADILLKTGSRAKSAETAVRSFDRTELPQYAIKELKAGPLQYFVYIHNKLANEKSFSATLKALQALSRTPQRYRTSTSLQALSEAAASIGGVFTTVGDWQKQYGASATIDQIQADIYRLEIKARVIQAWRRLRQVATEVVHELDCYDEVAPFEKRGLLILDPKRCRDGAKCHLVALLRSTGDDLIKVREANLGLPESRETKKRAKVLREIARKKNPRITDDQCRCLGDAVFTLLCGANGTILTTNVRDHRPLAEAIGKNAVSPEEVANR